MIKSICALFLFSVAGVSAAAQVNVLTQHNDNARTGQNLQEIILTPANVTPNHFGKLFALPVDGQVYAQPLYVSNLAIPGKGTHNVVFVATEADSVYAFDADNNTGADAAPLWKASLLDTAHGATAGEAPMKDSVTFKCGNITPYIGITSTPVIDLPSGSLYVETKSVAGTVYIHRLHVLDIATGSEKPSAPIVIGGSVTGTGQGSMGGYLSFDPLHQLNRAGLLLWNNLVFVAFGSHCDVWPFHGWIFAYDKTTLQQKGVYNLTPNGSGASIWMSGAGIAADATGNLFVATANGTFSQGNPLELGDSIVKLAVSNGTMSVADYFTPFDQNLMNAEDLDLGSGGVLLLPDQLGTHPHLMIQAGKGGRIYVIDRDNMTANSQHYCATCGADPQVLQESAANEVGVYFATPAYWNNTTYWSGSGDYLRAIPVVNGTLDFAHQTAAYTFYGYPGSTPSISANGTTTGIVWSVNSGQYGPPGPGPAPAVLHAHDATKILRELYSSSMAINHRDAAGNAVKFAVPTVANGKVYVGTVNEVDVYGLLGSTPVAATPVITPSSGIYQSSATVSISDSMFNATIFYTTNGAAPTQTSTRYTGPFVVNTCTTVKAIATGAGYLNSPVTSASYAIGNQPIMYEPESLPFVTSGPVNQKLPWFGFSDGMGMAFIGTKFGDNITYQLNIAKPGTYDVKVGVKKYWTRGIWQLTVNGKSVGPFRDDYAPSEAFVEWDLGNMTVTAAGGSNFMFTVIGHNAASQGYTMAFDYIKLTPQ